MPTQFNSPATTFERVGNVNFRRAAANALLDKLGLPPADRIPAEQMALLRSATPAAMGGYIFNTCIAALAISGKVDSSDWIIWTVASLAIAVTVLARRTSISRSPGEYVRRRALHRTIVFSILLALPWASLALFFFDSTDPARLLVIVALLVGMAASGAVLLAPVYPAAVTFIATILAPPIAIFATSHQGDGLGLLAFLGLSYAFFLMSLVVVVARISIGKSLAGRKLEATFAEIKVASERIGHVLENPIISAEYDSADALRPHSDIIADLNYTASRLIAQEAELRRSQARISSLIESAMDAIISLDEDNCISSINPAAETMFDRKGPLVIGRSVKDLLEAQSASKLCELLDDIKSRSRDVETTPLIEMKGMNASGGVFPVEVSIAKAVADGQVAMTLIVRDVSRRKYSEAKLDMLMREVNHRSRNLLAVLSSICAVTAARTTTQQEFNTKFASRLHSLAKSHEIIMNDKWTGSSLMSLIGTQAEPFQEKHENIFRVSGPEVFLQPRAMQNLGLAFHELATNSAKYGALSAAGGNIYLKWRVLRRADGSPLLRIVWREVGGPRITRGPKQGFGSLLLDSIVGGELDGKSRSKFLGSGLIWQAEVGPAHFSSAAHSSL